MDAVGIGVAVNLSGGTATHAIGEPSELERTKKLADELFPGRFLEYMNLDYAGWDAPDFAQRAVAQVEAGAREGAAGLAHSPDCPRRQYDRAARSSSVFAGWDEPGTAAESRRRSKA